MNPVNSEKINLKFLFNLTLHNQKISIKNFAEEIKNRLDSYKNIENINNLKNNFHYSLLLHSTNRKYFNSFIFNEIQIFEKKLQLFQNNEKENFFKKYFLFHLKNFNGEKISRDTYFTPERNEYFELPHSIKVHFSKILSRTKKHEIFLEGGYADLKINFYDDILISEYKNYLRGELERVHAIHLQVNDRRIFKFQHLLNSAEKKLDSAVQLNQLMKRLPPCIFNIIHNFKLKGWMSYATRTTLNRFMKNANVPVDDTIALYKKYYNCTDDEFKKNHLYNIKHDYGLEGKKIEYKMKRCSVLIADAFTNKDAGCMWSLKKGNSAIFNEYEKQYKITVGDIEDVNCMKKCGQIYERLHKRAIDEIETPIDFIK